MNWRESTLFAIDCESTGLDTEKDRIVELGACLCEPDGNCTRFGTLVNPGIPIPQEATDIHGISDDDVKGKPSLDDIAERFLERVFHQADVLVGYNCGFDSAMLRVGLGDRWGLAINGKPVLDALTLVRLDNVGRYWKGSGRHKLAAVAKRMKIERRGRAHRASSDAELAIKILFRFGDRLPEDAHEASEFLADQAEAQELQFQDWKTRNPRSDET